MTVRFVTLGCKLNFAESSALGRSLLAGGHTRAEDGEPADVCILNTCTVTDTADHKCRQALCRLRRENPDAVIVVTGCYAQLAADNLSKVPAPVTTKGWKDADYIVGNDEKFNIPELVAKISERVTERPVVLSTPIREVESFHGALSFSHVDSEDEEQHTTIADRSQRTRCFLKVQDGCNYFCTYCTIPYARGKSRNPHIAELVVEAQKAVTDGAKEIVLTGVNIADFGRSTGETFLELLQALDNMEGEYRLRIGSCEPNLLTTEIIDQVADSRHIAPHFHIPLQSGSNEVLQIMKRHYTRELFAERVAYIRKRLPYAFIGVDCMVGVRGETEAYFNDYLSFVEQLDVSQLHVFTYSERARTRMLEMDLPIVPTDERKRRSDILRRLSEQKTKAFYAANNNRELTVLWESRNAKGQMSGFSENYIRVVAAYDPEKVNTFQKITYHL
ncbi:MAG: tRNA (N(6)-L-threonylcarbamoyladenosine(37)-C(2))-methylthiotransferase MtaB [Paludibacteraceae bacterium]|nr:tRNA (N(6)-L-threonylcarbamoyladenosine(37)-C(2))-methylthiotransferase MtaB [Paludibacteraceae bacterium]